MNVFQQVRSVDRIATRFQSTCILIIHSNSLDSSPTNFSNYDRTCGFLYLFALSGQKMQVFCRSTDLVWRVGGFQKVDWQLNT